MEEELALLAETLRRFDGVTVLDTSTDPPWVHFKSTSETSFSVISIQANDLREQFGCGLLILNNPDDPEDFSYQLLFERESAFNAIVALNKKLIAILDSQNDPRLAKLKELGLPDLSLVTIRQMATELKQRDNLTFAIVWIENSERNNIAIEGTGNPTQLVGLLTRGTHMAIEWADKNIKYFRPREE